MLFVAEIASPESAEDVDVADVVREAEQVVVEALFDEVAQQIEAGTRATTLMPGPGRPARAGSARHPEAPAYQTKPRPWERSPPPTLHVD